MFSENRMNKIHDWLIDQIGGFLSKHRWRKSCSILSPRPFTFPRVSAEAQLTPMMAQYRRIKGELPKDALLLFRLGDFYEMFFEDAQAGAQLLNVALTKRGVIPMCGIPLHLPAAQGGPQGGDLRAA